MTVSDYLQLSESSATWYCAICVANTTATRSLTSNSTTTSVSHSLSAIHSTVEQPSSNRCPISLSVTHLNVHSLLGHFDQVVNFVERSSPDTLALSETCLDATVDSELFMSEFTIHRSVKDCHGGGVCIYVRNCLTCKRVTTGSGSSTFPVESVWLDVPSIPSLLLIGCVYRPPATQQTVFIASLTQWTRHWSRGNMLWFVEMWMLIF